MSTAQPEHDLLSEIPSPSRRLWIGLCIILSIFVVFAVYTIHEIRWLEDFQVNVVQRNRKASLQLLRLQNDAYLLAISLRDMALTQAPYPIHDWEAEFDRLRADMENAVMLEGRFAVSNPATADKRTQLRATLVDFGGAADQVFALAQRGEEAEARKLTQSKLESKRAVISEIVARLLVLNDQTQAEATEKINLVYGNVKRDILILIGVLFLLALGTGLYTLQASGKAFERLHHLAEKLQAQSEQMRMLSWKLIDVQERTLRHVARDLHDEFGQILTAIGAMLGRAGQKALDKDPVFVQDVEAVKKIVEDTLQTVRDESQIFRPAILDDFGLSQTLVWFVQQFTRQTGIQVHYEGKISDGFFLPESSVHLYRIVQEALNNVARHSDAREAWVTVEEQEGELKLEIRDNGAGFEVSADGSRVMGQGIGLMGMRERAEHLNGSFKVLSSPGKGCVVSVRVPLRKPAARTADQKAS
jgi:signal transduction histidine kinase